MSGVRPITIAMVAGEVSGDNLGAPLMRALKQKQPNIRFVGIGGPAMIAEGLESLYDMERLSVNAFPLLRVPELVKILLTTKTRLKEQSPDCFIGIDYNFFNGLLEGMMKRAGIRTVHYVSPTVWAWRSGRLRKIKKHIDMMLTLYPFETEIYAEHGIDACYVGHHKAREISPTQGQTEKAPARQALGLEDADKVVAILPGSRSSEVALIGPVFFRTAELLGSDFKFVVPATNRKRAQQIKTLWKSLIPDIPIKITDDPLAAMTAADAVLVKSGTATLEAMLLRRPMVMAYRLGKFAYSLISRMVNTPYFALPIILAGREVVPEFIQDDADPVVMAETIKKLMEQSQDELMVEFDAIHQRLSPVSELFTATEVLKLCEQTHV